VEPLDVFLGVPDRLAPQVAGVHQFRGAIRDEQIYGLRGGAPKITMSQPANFSSAPKQPPELEQAMAPVSGPLVTTE